MKELKHFGVVGMRWGVRRRQTRMANRTLQKELYNLHKKGGDNDMDGINKILTKHDKAMASRTKIFGKKAMSKIEAQAFLEKYKRDKVNTLADAKEARRKADKIAATMATVAIYDLLSGGRISGAARNAVGKVAWATGKVIKSYPVR